MANEDRREGSTHRGGFWDPLRSAFTTLADAWHTRVELLITELQEELERFKQTVLLAVVLLYCATLGIILLTIFIVALLWQAGWIYAVGGLALICLGAAATAALLLRKQSLTRSGLFSATLGELGKDRDYLRSSRRE